MTITREEVLECLKNLDLGVEIDHSGNVVCVGPQVELYVYTYQVVVYPVKEYTDNIEFDDIFDLQEWMINIFK